MNKKVITEMNLKDLQQYCIKIERENNDLKKQLLEIRNVFNVFNEIKNNAIFGINLLNNV